MSKDLSSIKPLKKAAKTKASVVVEKKRPQIIGVARTLLLAIVSFFGAQIIATIVVLSVLGIVGKNQDQVIDVLTNNPFAQLAFLALSATLTVYFLIHFIKIHKADIRETFMLRRISGAQVGEVFLLFIGYFLTMAVVTVLVSLATPINVEQTQELGIADPQDFMQKAAIFVMLVMLPPIYEELLFRGYLFNRLKKYASFAFSAVVTSVLFGLAHLEFSNFNWIAAIDTLVLSGFLIYISQKHQSIYSAILMHAIKNCIAFIALFVL